MPRNSAEALQWRDVVSFWSTQFTDLRGRLAWKRLPALALAIAVCAVSTLRAAPLDETENPAGSRPPDNLGEDIKAAETNLATLKLDKVISEIKFDDASFESALKRLELIGGLTIIPNWPALESLAIEKDASVSLKLHDVSVRTALGVLLDTVSGGEVEIAFQVDGPIVRLSTKADLDGQVTVAVYVVNDLVNEAGRKTGKDAQQAALKKLASAVMQTVEPESWKETGGNIGSMSIVKGSLVVRQSKAAHEQIQRLLDDLRLALQNETQTPFEIRQRIRRNREKEEALAEATLDTRRRLARVTQSVDFDNKAFENVIDDLRGLTGINIIPNWAALESQAIEKDAEVTLRLDNVTIERLLRVVLDDVSGGEVELDYSVDGNIVRISTLEDLSRRRLNRLYNIHDLLKNVPGLDSTVRAEPHPGPRDEIQSDNREATARSAPTPAERFAAMVMATIDPESWQCLGGNVGNISIFRNTLIVSQTPPTQDQIRLLIDDLMMAYGVSPGDESDKAFFALAEEARRGYATATAETEKRLGAVLPELQLDALPLEFAIERLRKMSGLNLVPNWAALEAQAVEKDAEINLKVNNIRFGALLELILSQLGEAELGYVADGETVRISTREDLDRERTLKLYDVRDLLNARITFADRPSSDADRSGSEADRKRKSTAEGPADFAGLGITDSARRLAKMIMDKVEPDSWREKGGNIGGISIFKGTLLVTQSAIGHRELGRMLRDLRRAQGLVKRD